MTDFLLLLNQTALGAIASFFLGLIWGSFFNVCILRIPAEESLISQPSHCPKCGTRIPWYLNIPFASYVWLRGQCRQCHQGISIQYPLIELASGLLFLALELRFGFGRHFACYAIFSSALLVISVIDLHHQIIPDEISLPGIVAGFLVSFLLHDISWWESLLGIGLGGGIFLAIAYAYEKISKREGLGGGDIKLLAMLGAWLGYRSILVLVVISSGLGSLVGIGFMLLRGKNFRTAIPFGPFLALAAVVYVFWGLTIQEYLFPPLP